MSVLSESIMDIMRMRNTKENKLEIDLLSAEDIISEYLKWRGIEKYKEDIIKIFEFLIERDS